jgi:hypothetical protein
MKISVLRKLAALTQDAQPPKEPEPDFTGWTRKEISDWQIAHMDLEAAAAALARLPPAPLPPPTPPEQYAAWDARDAAILAERKAQAAADRLAEHPGSAAAQINARAAREAADLARRAAEEAERLAEEAKRRPPPVENPDAPGSGAAPAKAKAEPKPQEERTPEPEPEPKPKEWWRTGRNGAGARHGTTRTRAAAARCTRPFTSTIRWTERRTTIRSSSQRHAGTSRFAKRQLPSLVPIFRLRGKAQEIIALALASPPFRSRCRLPLADQPRRLRPLEVGY